MIILEICINCKGLNDIILFLTNLFFTRRLPRSTTLRLLKQHRNLSTRRSTLYRLTILQSLIACMCFHSNAFHVIVLHICEYVYFRRTPTRRASQWNAKSRIKLEHNLIKVTMFVMPDDLILDIHSTAILYYLYHFCWFTVFVRTRYYHMPRDQGLVYIMELLLQVPECTSFLYDVILMLQVLECPSLFVWWC